MNQDFGPAARAALSRRRLVALAGLSSLAGGAVAAACAPGGQQSPASLVGGRSVKLTYAYPITVPEQDQLRALPAKRVTAQHPNVTIEEVTGPGGQFKEKMLALAAAGSLP